MSDTTSVDDYQAEVRALREELVELKRERHGLRAVVAENEARPRRLTQGEILRALLERMARAGGEHSSIEISRNARHETQLKVAVRTGESEDVATVEDAAAKARAVFDALSIIYPPPAPSPPAGRTDD